MANIKVSHDFSKKLSQNLSSQKLTLQKYNPLDLKSSKEKVKSIKVKQKRNKSLIFAQSVSDINSAERTLQTPNEIKSKSISRVKSIVKQATKDKKKKATFKTQVDEDEGLGTQSLQHLHNYNVESTFTTAKVTKYFYQKHQQRQANINSSNKASQKLSFKTKSDSSVKQETHEINQKSQKKKRQKKRQQKNHLLKNKMNQVKDNLVTFLKNIGTKIKTTLTSSKALATIIIGLVVSLLVAIIFMIGMLIANAFATSAENAYIFTPAEATEIDKRFTEKEVDYVIKLKRRADRANRNTVINYENVGHEPHELLALINVMVLPEYIETGDVSDKSLETALETVFNTRYQFKEEKKTYTHTDENGKKTKQTLVYLTSNTESFNNIVSGKSGDIPADTQEFLDLIGSDASRIANENGLYASVMIAQAILESGSGSSDLASPPYYNLFGIKGSYEGETIYMNTKEDNGSGSQYTITAGFRDYPSYVESMEDYAKVLLHQPTEGFYAPAWKENTSSYRDATAFLQGTYATDTSYASKLNSIIEDFDLTRYDSMTPVSADSDKDKKEVEKVTRTLEEIEGGEYLNFTAYEKELYKKQKDLKGLMGTYPSPLEEDWGSKIIEAHGFKWNKETNKKEETDGIKLKVDQGENVLSLLPAKVKKIENKDDKLSVEIKSDDTMTFIYPDCKIKLEIQKTICATLLRDQSKKE